MPEPDFLNAFLIICFICAMVGIYLVTREETKPLRKTKNLPVKDPADSTLTPSSTQWEKEHYCRTCSASISSKEWIADCCNSCGTFDRNLLYYQRTYRRIWNGSKWMWQYKYGPTEFLVCDNAL